jgi:hypothetical protein
MKFLSVALATSLLAISVWSQPAAAQGAPQGSYLRSCTNVSVRGDTLSASCRRQDGREDRSTLAGFKRCVGDIGNDNGVLRCALPGGGQAVGQAVAEPGPQPPPRGILTPLHPPSDHAPPPPAYGAPPYAPTPYGAPPADREGDRGDRCRGLHRESDELRARLDRERDPADRARIERRLHEIHDEEERCH